MWITYFYYTQTYVLVNLLFGFRTPACYNGGIKMKTGKGKWMNE